MSIINLLVLSLITAVSSALHGGNYLSKGIILAAHACTCIGLLYMQTGISIHLLAAPIASALYWFVIRSGKVARAELTYQRANSRKNFMKILKVYAPVILPMTGLMAFFNPIYAAAYFICSAISITLPSYLLHNDSKLGYKLWFKAHQKNLKEGTTDKVIDNRRVIEFVTGTVVGGFTIAALFDILVRYI